MNLKSVKIVDYDIISSQDISVVRANIKKRLDEDDGWHPYGYMSTDVVGSSTIVYTQTMAKYVPELWPED